MSNTHPYQIGFKFAGNPLGDAHSHLESQLALALDSELRHDIRHFSISANAKLVQGDHAISATGRAALLGVEPDTEMTLNMSVVADKDKTLILDNLKLAFSKPLHLKNIFTTIDELTELLANSSVISFINERLDRDNKGEKNSDESSLTTTEIISKTGLLAISKASSYFEKITDLNAWKSMKEILGKGIEKAEELLDNSFDSVRLSGFEIVLNDDEEKPCLDFYYSGEIVINDKIKKGFEHSKRSFKLFPSIDAHLSYIMNKFYVNKAQGSNLVKTFLNMIDTICGSFDAGLSIRPMSFDVITRDGRTLQFDINMEDSLQSSGIYTLKKVHDTFSCDIQGSLPFIKHSDIPNQIHLSFETTTEKIILCGNNLVHPDWQITMLGKGTDVQGKLEFQEGFTIHPESIHLHATDENTKGGIDLCFDLESIPIYGVVDWGIDANAHEIHVHTFNLHTSCQLSTQNNQFIKLGQTRTDLDVLRAKMTVDAGRSQNGDIGINALVNGMFKTHSHLYVLPLPEIMLVSNHATADMEGTLDIDFHIHAENGNDELLTVEFDNSKADVYLHNAELKRDNYTIQIPSHINTNLLFKHARHSISGLSDCVVQITYLTEKSPVIINSDKTANLLPDLLIGHPNTIDMCIADNGTLHFENGEGMFDHHFFNALLKPMAEQEKIVEILNHPSISKYLWNFGETIIFPLWPSLRSLFERVGHWRERCIKENIFTLPKLVHMPNMALAISLFLFDNDSAVPEILPSLERIMHADGIDRYKLEELFDRAFPDTKFDGISHILKWLNRFCLTVPYTPPEHTHQLALCDNPKYLPYISLLPNANEIYDGDWADGSIAKRCYEYASGFTIDQLEWIITNKADCFESASLQTLKKLLNIKKRILKLEPREGTFLIQDYNIDVFLGPLIHAENLLIDKLSPKEDPDDNVADFFKTWLCPADMARLISAGIASRYHGIIVEVNQHKLLKLLMRRSREYAIATFYEIGQHNERTLAGLLLSYLAQKQRYLKTPIDRVDALTKLLGIEIPRSNEYAVGGAKASMSYMDAIFGVATQITHSCTCYNAASLRMQTYRYETPDAQSSSIVPKAPYCIALRTDLYDSLYHQIENIIQNAQQKTHVLIETLNALTENQITEARELWFKACLDIRECIGKDQSLLQSDIVKSFMSRLYEGLRIASVEEDIIKAHDDVRGWMAQNVKMSEEELLKLGSFDRMNLIIDHLYANETDRNIIKSDPLVWFVPNVPKGNVDLTLISAMGVITNGRNGHELETVFERLESERNIRLIRADTGLIKSLEFNADRIEEAIDQATGPYALIGYSQGCANMMRAESRLYAGTPEKRKKLDNLVSRNFICSALNGSVHAVCGIDKYCFSLIDGEHTLKTLSSRQSKYLTGLAFTCLQRILDSPLLNMSLSSLESLSPHGLHQLARDAQYKPNIISMETQGIVKTHLPEIMVFMVSHFEKQCDIPNDSQVGIDCAHSYIVYNQNDSVNVLKQEAIPAKPLDIHHWSSLKEEIQLAQTEQDYREYAYRGPKSMYIVPWINALILMGQIHILS